MSADPLTHGHRVTYDAKNRNHIPWPLTLLGIALLLGFVVSRTQGSIQEDITRLSLQADLSRHPSLYYVPGSTAKVEQLVGDTDAQSKQPTASQTASRYGIQGTDLGYSFEHNGQTVFLFGDTVGASGGDVVGFSDATDPNAPMSLNFVTGADGQYLRVEPPGISMGPNEVPVGGISLNGSMFVAVKTHVTPGKQTDETVLTRYDDGAKTFQPLRSISKLPDGHFITLSLRLAPQGLPGLPTDQPYVLMFGTGHYRHSSAYLAAVPAASFDTGAGTVYYAGQTAGIPMWDPSESKSEPIILDDTIGDISVTFVPQLGLWVSLYDSRSPLGIVARYSMQPWGPWSGPQLVFDRKAGYGSFIHDPSRSKDDGLAGPVIMQDKPAQRVAGGMYAPYIIDRFTQVAGDTLTLQYVMSTWNPYVVVRMKSSLQIRP